MQSVYLVQRLKAPVDQGEANSFSFGGGLRDGGISKEGMEVIRKLWTFDYMGSAEFEFGAVPKALETLYDIKNTLITDVILDGRVFIIAPKDIMSEVKEWIGIQAKLDYNGHLKEQLGLKEILNGKHDRYKGWLKIEQDKWCDEPFMFFVDEQMFLNTSQIFGI